MPTNEDDLNQIYYVIIDRLNCIYSPDCIITPMIIKSCISKLKADKTDGDIGFNSNHLIHGSQRLCGMLSILINEMPYHGYYQSDLLKSTNVSIPKEKSASLSNSNNYHGILLFNCINNLYDYVINY